MQVLMRRDGLSRGEAKAEIAEMYQRTLEGEDPEEILREDYGLEPDFVFDILALEGV